MSSQEVPTFGDTGKHWLHLSPADLLFAHGDSEWNKRHYGTNRRAKTYLRLKVTLYLFHDNAYDGALYLFRNSSPEQEPQSNTNSFAMPTEDVVSSFDFADNSAQYDEPSQDIPIISVVVSQMLKAFSDHGHLKKAVPVDMIFQEPLITHDTEFSEMANRSKEHDFRELGVMVLLSLPDAAFSLRYKELVISRAGRDPAYYQNDASFQSFQELSDFRDGHVIVPSPKHRNYPYANPLKDSEGARSLTPAFMENARQAFERYRQWRKNVDMTTRGYGG